MGCGKSPHAPAPFVELARRQLLAAPQAHASSLGRLGAVVKIADWVRAGGKLWACVGALRWNEYNQPSTVLNEAFGVSKRGMVTQKNWVPWAAASWSATATRAKYEQLGTLRADSPLFGGALSLPAWGARLDVTPTTAQTIGTYDDGKPAVLLNRFGKGQAMLVGALVGEAYVRMHYPAGLPCGKEGWSFDLGAPARKLACGLAAGVQRPVTLSLPGIYTSVMDSPQGTLVFLNNAMLAAQTDLTRVLTPTATVRVPVACPVKGVESASAGAVKHAVQNGDVTFTLALPNTDVVLIRR